VQITTSDIELTIDGFPCRTYVAAPKPTSANAKYPGIALYSEIFQLTGPICRTANRLAGHGFVVAAPEIYHRSCPPGLVIAYDDPGRMYGNYLAHTTPVAHFDATAAAVFDHFETRGDVKHDSSGPRGRRHRLLHWRPSRASSGAGSAMPSRGVRLSYRRT
jgi:carboxymethylenebutenolidase